MNLSLLASIFTLTAGLTTQAAIYKLSADKGQISFLAKGRPALISIKGEGEGPTAALTEKEQTLNGVISFQLNSLKTGIELRDDHLKNKYLEVEKYPTATITVSDLKIPETLTDRFNFKGILNLHGVAQPVEGSVSIKGSVSSGGEPQTPKLYADFKIKLSDFKIEIPSFKGVTVAEEVQLKVEAPIWKEE